MRIGLFLLAALAVFMGPYLVTEREVFFPSRPAPAAAPEPTPTQRQAESVVRSFLEALPAAYAAGDPAPLLPLVTGPQALSPLHADLAFLRRRGRALQLRLENAQLEAQPAAGNVVRVESRERWEWSEGDAPERRSGCTGTYLVDLSGGAPRISAWELFP